MKNNFIVSYNVKNYICFDGVNNQFKIPSHSIFKKTAIHNYDEIAMVKFIEDEDDFGRCIALEILIKLKNDKKYYISLLKKPVRYNGLRYKLAYKNAEKIASYLEFVQAASKVSDYYSSKT